MSAPNHTNYKLSSLVAFVTGAAQGIGKQTVIQLIKKGIVNLSLCDININKLNLTKKEILSQYSSNNLNILTNKCDVTKESDVKNTIDLTISHFGRLDFAVNNAGILGKANRIDNISLLDYNNVMNVNLKGVFLCMKHELKYFTDNLKKHNKKTYLDKKFRKNYLPCIVNMASNAGFVAMPLYSIYSASKFGVIGLTKTAAREYGKLGIRINNVSPTLTKTQLGKDIINTNMGYKAFTMTIPFGRIAKTEEIANSIVFLLFGPQFISGTTLSIDGGLALL